MSDEQPTPASPPAAPPAGAPTAGRLLREAREARGLHVAALAIQLKVPPRKLEALEADRYDELLDPTFTRALAQAVCRALKTDPAPVLALLPRRPLDDLSPVAQGGLNTSYRDAGSRPGEVKLPLTRGPLIVLALIALAAAGVLLAPADFSARYVDPLLRPKPAASAPEVAAQAAPVPASQPVVEAASAVVPSEAPVMTAPNTVAAAPASVPAATAAASAAPVAAVDANALVLSATEASWVQVLDGDSRPLLIRQLAAGESASVNGAPPLRLIIGNAAGTRVTWRGQAVDLAPRTRDNVARFELTTAP